MFIRGKIVLEAKQNEITQLLVQETMCKPVINLSDIEIMIVPFDGNPFKLL